MLGSVTWAARRVGTINVRKLEHIAPIPLLRPAGIFRVSWPSPLFRCSARTRATLHSMLEDSPHTRLLS